MGTRAVPVSEPVRDVRVVIGVPLYNSVRRGHLGESLDSLLAQTYPHVAFVLVDDASSDGTFEVTGPLP
jgi:glycosyltransferase involved in cell wall biosynthesis